VNVLVLVVVLDLKIKLIKDIKNSLRLSPGSPSGLVLSAVYVFPYRSSDQLRIYYEVSLAEFEIFACMAALRGNTTNYLSEPNDKKLSTFMSTIEFDYAYRLRLGIHWP
jgi:hypothetical protein